MGECEEIPLEQLEVKPSFLGHESKCWVRTTEPKCGCGPLVPYWPGWTWLDTNTSTSFAPIWESPPGLLRCIVFFFLTSQWSLPGESLYWTGYGKNYSYFLFVNCRSALRPQLWLELHCEKHHSTWKKHPSWLLASLSAPEEESLPGDALQPHSPPTQGESLRVGSGPQHKLCSRRCVCEPIFWLCLISDQRLWLPRPSAKKKSSCFMPLWLHAVNFILQLALCPVLHH